MDITPVLSKLRAYVEQRDFAGVDPYDALNSPIVRVLSGGSKYGRIAWTQALRRSPIDVRRLLMIKPSHNPKGIGLFMGGYARLYRSEPNLDCLANMGRLYDLLLITRSAGCSGNGWGYNFDWQSRAFYAPKGTPTIVNSSFVGHALLDAWEATGQSRFLDLAVPVSDFILSDLNRTAVGDSICFSYTPNDSTAVHNANLLGASLLIRLHRITGGRELRDLALAALKYSMRCQKEDGSWFYAEAKAQRWVDSFHTGFNLTAIRYFLEQGEGGEYSEAYQRGISFYKEAFFLEDGTPKYYHDRVFPIDIHAPMEAIAFLSGLGESSGPLVEKILAWTLANLWDSAGYFYFRRSTRMVNRIPYIRWGQAWALFALAEYALRKELSPSSERCLRGC